MKTVLSIAGSDCSGGAGIQADLKTMAAYRVYGMSVITALTAQNTTGVTAIQEATPEFVRQQMDAVFTDIPPDAVKIGMVSNPEIIRVIAERLAFYGVKELVVDPVMVATSGSKLLQDGAIDALKQDLFPLARVLTPNIPEAELLTGLSIETAAEMERAAAQIASESGTAVLLKGGHLSDSADDLLWQDGQAHWFRSERIDNPNNHGTGCTLSSAIACGLARGLDLTGAVALAKTYIAGTLRAGLNLGSGSGPLDHGAVSP